VDDLAISYADHCAYEGICPGCCEVSCICGTDLDAEKNEAPARTVRPVYAAPFLTASTLRLGSMPRINERASFISSGAL
jgi:hypothetical protein